MLPINALVSDLGQRIVTLNKREQRQQLMAWLRPMRIPPGAKVLDFGCGTGLFGRTLHRLGLTYCGYDPDAAAIQYAARLYPDLTFVSRWEAVEAAAPYDLVLANCCFHHISDTDLRQTTLPAIARLMHPASIFLLCDVLPMEGTASPFRRGYNRFEQGDAKRAPGALERLVADRFTVRARRVERSFAFSVPLAANPFYNDLIRLELVL